MPATLVGLSWQQSLADKKRWKPWPRSGQGGTYPLGQYVGAFVWAYLSVLVLVCTFYFIYFMQISQDIENAMSLFLFFAPVYFTFTILAGLQAVFSAFSLGEMKKATGSERRKAPLLHGVIVLVILGIFYESYSDMLAPAGQSGALTYWFLIIQSSFVAYVATYLSASGGIIEAPKPTAAVPAGGAT